MLNNTGTILGDLVVAAGNVCAESGAEQVHYFPYKEWFAVIWLEFIENNNPAAWLLLEKFKILSMNYAKMCHN